MDHSKTGPFGPDKSNSGKLDVPVFGWLLYRQTLYNVNASFFFLPLPLVFHRVGIKDKYVILENKKAVILRNPAITGHLFIASF